MRFKHSREFYVRPHHQLMESDTADLAVYLDDSGPQPRAMVFQGRAQKPTWHFRFSTAERREKWIAETIANRREQVKANASYRAERRTNKLQLDDILRTCWGYDQTNVEYYQVTAMIGRSMVEIREIGRVNETDGLGDRSKCAPAPDQFIEGRPAMRCRVQGDGVRAKYGQLATRIKPRAEVAGVKVYDSAYWSAYA